MAALPGRTGDGRFTGEQAALRRVATLVARSAPPEDVFAVVTEEAGRLVHLSGDLLSFSRRVQVNTEKLDLNSLIGSMMDLLIMSMSGRAQVIFEPSPILPSVRADRGQLEQVLLNLAVNARDAMPAGGTLTIRTGTAGLSADSSRLHPGAKPARHVELPVWGCPPSTASSPTPGAQSRPIPWRAAAQPSVSTSPRHPDSQPLY